MKENFPNLVKEIHIQVQEAQRVPNKLDPKKVTPRHIIKIRKVKDKERILVLPSVVQWIKCRPVNPKIASSIPTQGTSLGSGPGLQLGACKRQPIDVSLNTSMFPSLTLSPKIKIKSFFKKARILKAAREKKRVTYKEVPIELSAHFSKETLQARRGWKEVFKVMKGKDLYLRLLYPAKLSFRTEGQMKCFPDKVKLKEFIIIKPL